MEIMVKLMFTILTANVMERNRKMSDLELLQELAKKTNVPLYYHVGTPGCKYCKGTGFVPISIWRKLMGYFIEGVPWKCIRKELMCMKCRGTLKEYS
jgi:hypothetical protein